jgi:signal transduction histidine kinase
LIGQTIILATPRIVNDLNSQELYGNISDLPARLIKSLMMAPLITSGKTIGLIMVENHRYYTFDDSDLETLETLAFQVASAIEHARLLKKTREIAIVEERTRLARDMHDGVAQNLAYLLLQVDRCLNMVTEGSKLEKQFEHISSLLKQNIDELRRNIFDLRPVALEGRSLFGVIENFVTEFGRRWNLKTTCTIDGQGADVSPEVESSLYRILQEALSNARQHAHCTQLWVNLAIKDNRWVMLQVKDNGHGFDVSQIRENPGRGKRRGLGLVSMRERVQSVRGELTVESKEGEGTQVLAVLPLENHILNGQERS